MMIRARSLTSLCLVGLLAATASCSSQDKPRGQLMIAIASDMAIPKDLDQVVVEVLDDAGNLQRLTYPIMPAELGKPMPGTLAVLPTNAGGQHVRVRLIAELDTEPPTARVVREAEVTVPTDRIAMLPMPLHWLCDGMNTATDDGSFQSNCPDQQTCVAGVCKPDVIDVRTLADYADASVFGGGDADGDGGHCIDVATCFASAAVLTPDATCSVPVPPGVPTDAINVALVTSNGDTSGDGECTVDNPRCFLPLDHDPVEGWDFSQAQDAFSIALPPIVCDKIAQKELAGVAVSTACATKDSSVPICGPWTTVETPSLPPSSIAGGGGGSNGMNVGGANVGGASVGGGGTSISSGASGTGMSSEGGSSSGGAPGIGEAGAAGASEGGAAGTGTSAGGAGASRGGSPGTAGSGFGTVGTAGATSSTCPSTQPVANSACSGALECVYASNDCACVSNAWRCTAPCPGECLAAEGTLSQPEIDDFEDANGDLYGTPVAFCASGSQGERSGFWYTFNDGSNDTQIPAPSTTAGALPQSGACHGGDWCMDTLATTGYTSYAGLGVDFNNVRGASKSCAYDASAYTGLSFWIRGTGVVRLALPMIATSVAAANVSGTCVAGTSGPGSACDDHYGYDLTLTGDWQQFTLDFTQLAQADWSGTQVVAPFDATQLLGLQFIVYTGQAFAFGVDDLSFY